MEVYDLSFNALVSNLQKDCTVFFCPDNCKFITTLKEDLQITLFETKAAYRSGAICQGKVYDTSHIVRLPMVYVIDTETYCDITLLSANDSMIQVIIFKYKDIPAGIEIEQDFDPYRLYYEYVGGISDLKSRVNFECEFLKGLDGENISLRDRVFRDNVNEEIIKRLFE